MNLFLPKESSKIVSNRTLNLRTIKNLLNEIFSKDISQNISQLKILQQNII